MDVSIVIVNYNTREFLKQCIQSIYNYTLDITFEIIVIDNASIDFSNEYIEQNYPNIILVKKHENIGFGRANNFGINLAKGRYVFLLNSDTILINNAIKTFFGFMEDRQDIGICGGTLLTKNFNYNHSYGNIPCFWVELLKHIHLYKFVEKSKDVPTEVGYIIGADMFIRKDLFDKFGGFDENFFMYFEETDLTRNFRKNGIKSFIIPEAQIVHLANYGTSWYENTNKIKMYYTSYFYYFKKHYSSCHSKILKYSFLLSRFLFYILTLDKKYFNFCRIIFKINC